jgi:hypothetical protein
MGAIHVSIYVITENSAILRVNYVSILKGFLAIAQPAADRVVLESRSATAQLHPISQVALKSDTIIILKSRLSPALESSEADCVHITSSFEILRHRKISKVRLVSTPSRILT